MSILSIIKSHVVLASTIVVVAVAGTIIAGRVASQKSPAADTGSNLKHVSLVDVDSFRNDRATVSADGIIESVSQVDLKSQMSAPLSSVNVALGDTVYAGQVIATLSNTDIQAQLDQTKASLNVDGVSVDASRKAAVDAIEDSYLKADEAVHSQFDPLFLNNTGTTPQLSNFINDRVLYDRIRATRADLTATFVNWKKLVDTLSATSSTIGIQSGFDLAETNIEIVRKLFDDVSKGLNDASTVILPSDATLLATWKATVSAARATLSGVATSLTSSERAFSVAGSAVQGSQAVLDKTIIRSPISGKVAALPLRTGELATPGQLVATIVGSGGLEVDAYASGEDISRIVKGAKATISGKISGIVSSVSPSVNQTNKKVQVKILITDPAANSLVIGENVSVAIDALKAATIGNASDTGYKLPIQDVKIVPGDAYVFTVDADSKLVRNPVTLGTVTGDYVEIRSGLSTGMKIATPVYELDEGQTVIVDE